ncbi:MAG: M16 family metallopeptidase, partial [Acidimicrobiales bacterium]
ALAVVNHVLGGGLSSRLFQEVREKRGLAYSVYSEWESHDDAGAMVVYAGTSPENTRQVLDLVNIEMDRLASSGITDRELEVARGNLRAEMLLSLEDSGARMSRIGRSQLLHREVIAADELCRRIERVSKPEVDAMAAQVLGAERTLSVVGPVTQSDLVPVTGTS